MKVATYNVNGVNGRLDVLLRWLEEASPDVVALQELKAPQEKFPVKAIEGRRIWRCLAGTEVLERCRAARRGSAAPPFEEGSTWRTGRRAKPVRQGNRRLDGIRGPFSPERQPVPRPKVRLQAPLVPAST